MDIKKLDYELCYDAYRGISFDPERRARQEQEGYLESFEDLYQKILKLDPEKTEEIKTDILEFESKYRKKRESVLSTKCGIVSAMIVGPAKFPTTRMQKRNDTEHRKIEECINGFKDYKNQGYKINYENIRNMGIDVNIAQALIVDVDYPVSVKREEFESSFSGVKFQINSGLIDAYKVATDIINDECLGVIFDIDDYIINEPPLAFIERQLAPDAKLFYYLTTIPRGDVDAYRFHFIVER